MRRVATERSSPKYAAVLLSAALAKALARALATALVAALVLGLAAGCGSRPPVAAKITVFDPPSGSHPAGAGYTPEATVRLENIGTEARTFWIGYSVRDPGGEWHDAPPAPVELASGEESTAYELSAPPVETSGYYEARASVWKENPEDIESGPPEAARLADTSNRAAFRLFNERKTFEGSLEASWMKPSRKLGRGRLEPDNVTVAEDRLRITLPANSLDGGEIASELLQGYGSYTARLKVPDAPTSITGFFLYRPPDFQSEIDIEVFNDPSGTVLFTTYSAGEQTHTQTRKLPFDPTRGFHDYTFNYRPGTLEFYVDGELLQTYEEGLPDRPMNLYLNAWFPTWLGGERPDSDRHAYVEWIEW